MHPSAMNTACAFFATYWYPGYRRVLDVGSRDVNGSVREVAPAHAEYLGVDLVPGPGVDQVIDDPLKLPFADGAFDVLVSSSCLEHDPCFWLTVAEMARVVRPGGLIYLNMPSNGPYHGYPHDHWRFYPDSGPALAGWLQRLGWSVRLVESFIAPMCSGSGWVDMVVILARTPMLRALPRPRLWQRIEGSTHVREADQSELADGQSNLEQDPFQVLQVSGRLAEQRDPRSAIAGTLLGSVQRGTLAYHYRGLPCLKSPFDLALYSLLIDTLQPATLIELGSFHGGSGLWFADQFRVRNLRTTILSVDRSPPPRTALLDSAGVAWLQGDVTDLGAVLPPERLASLPHPWLVVEDSAHTVEATLAVLEFFHRWLQGGDYVVVEDGIVADLAAVDPATYRGYADGPRQAMQAFIQRYPGRYSIDTSLTDYYGHNVTWNTNGYLRVEQ